MQYRIRSIIIFPMFTLDFTQYHCLLRLLLAHSADGNTPLSSLSFQIVVLKMMTVWMGIVLQPRPSRSQKFPRSRSPPPPHAGPAQPVASSVFNLLTQYLTHTAKIVCKKHPYNETAYVITVNLCLF